MKNVYFFCDSQMNILTSYFVMKIYFNTDKYQNYLYVCNNSDNSITRAERAKQIDIWDKVEIIESAYKDSDEMIKLGEGFNFQNEDIIYIFALQNPFARLIYKKARQRGSQIRIIDEGIALFCPFLLWQKDHRDEMFADIDVLSNPLEGWCYEPHMYDLPDNIVLKKIELSKTLEDDEQCQLMQQEVRDIFCVPDEDIPQVIYFDQYYSLEGRTTPLVEKYLLKKLSFICSELDFIIKKHPMERGFDSKYSELDVPIMQTSDSPWEAIYFVNIYKKTDRKMIYLTGYSTSISTPLLMYGDKNYYIVLLNKIYDQYLKASPNNENTFYARLLEIENISIYMPQDYDEFQMIISKLTGKQLKCRDRLAVYDHAMLCKLCKSNIDLKSGILLCNLDIYHKDEIVYQMRKEIVLDGEDFKIRYDIPARFGEGENQYKWRPCEYAFISFKDIEIIARTEACESRYAMDSLVPENPVIIKKDNYVESQFYKPSYLIRVHSSKLKEIEICGKCRIDFNKDRLINRLENTYMDLICSAENKHNNLIQKIRKKNELELKKMDQEFLSKYQKCKTDFEKKYQELAEREEQDKKIIMDYKKRLGDLENSLSWKITKPFRLILKKIEKSF